MPPGAAPEVLADMCASAFSVPGVTGGRWENSFPVCTERAHPREIQSGPVHIRGSARANIQELYTR